MKHDHKTIQPSVSGYKPLSLTCILSVVLPNNQNKQTIKEVKDYVGWFVPTFYKRRGNCEFFEPSQSRQTNSHPVTALFRCSSPLRSIFPGLTFWKLLQILLVIKLQNLHKALNEKHCGSGADFALCAPEDAGQIQIWGEPCAGGWEGRGERRKQREWGGVALQMKVRWNKRVDLICLKRFWGASGGEGVVLEGAGGG